MKKSIWFLASALSLLAAAPAMAQASLNLASPGQIRFLTNPIYPPMEFVDPKTGALSGFDIDLGKAIAAKMGLKDSWSQAAFVLLFCCLQTRCGVVFLL